MSNSDLNDLEQIDEAILRGDLNARRWEDNDIALRLSAATAKLPWNEMTPLEAKIFSDFNADELVRTKYLFLRNKAIQQFHLEPNLELSVERLKNSLPYPYDCAFSMKDIYRVHSFLSRYGFINWGSYFHLTALKCFKKYKVLIIGAGIAGMTAYRHLSNLGIPVQILEAESRQGGRVYTVRHQNENTANGRAYAEAGALIIWNSLSNPLTMLSRQVDGGVMPFNHETSLYNSEGQEISTSARKTRNKVFDHDLQFLIYYLDARNVNVRDLSMLELIDTLHIAKQCKSRNQTKENYHLLRCIQVQYVEFKNSLKILEAACEESYQNLKNLMEQNHRTLSADDQLKRELRIRVERKDLSDACDKHDELVRKIDELKTSFKELSHMLQDTRPDFEFVLNRFDYEPRPSEHKLAELEYTMSAPLDKISAEYWTFGDGHSRDGTALIASNGLSNLIKYLTQPCKTSTTPKHDFGSTSVTTPVLLQHIVREIRTDAKGCTLLIQGGNNITEMRADAVICTLPIGVLKASVSNLIDAPLFKPPLPEKKINAIREIGAGVNGTLVMFFEKQFWATQRNGNQVNSELPHFIGISRDFKEYRGESFTFVASGNSAVLVALYAGEYAENLASKQEDEIVSMALADLRKIFKDAKYVRPTKAILTNWHDKNFFKCSNSYLKPGCSPDIYDVLAESVSVPENSTPRLFFAGEHTDKENAATLHGAAMSGTRAATEVANILIGEPYAATTELQCVTLSDEENDDIEILPHDA